MVAAPAERFASMIACRKDPAPESLVLVTMSGAPGGEIVIVTVAGIPRVAPPVGLLRTTENVVLLPALLIRIGTVIVSLLRWGDRWMDAGEEPPVQLRHRDCGTVMHPELACPACGEWVGARDVEAVPAGASPRG